MASNLKTARSEPALAALPAGRRCRGQGHSCATFNFKLKVLLHCELGLPVPGEGTGRRGGSLRPARPGRASSGESQHRKRRLPAAPKAARLRLSRSPGPPAGRAAVGSPGGGRQWRDKGGPGGCRGWRAP